MDAALARTINPNWFPCPDSWVWRRPDGRQQGFGLAWRDDPGMANLQWLALDMQAAPRELFDVRMRPLYLWLSLHGQQLTVSASLLTLGQWVREMQVTVKHPKAPLLPQLQQLLELAQKRLSHAHT